MKINSHAPLIYADDDCSHMYEGLTTLQSVHWNNEPSQGEGGFQTEDVTDMSYMFAGCTNLNTFSGLEWCNTTNVTTMAHMFDGCTHMSGWTIDLSNFNTHNLNHLGMVAMFNNCSGLQTIDLSSFHTDQITTMENLFNGCAALTTLDLRSFNTAQVTNMKNLFNGCVKMDTLYIDNFDMSNVTNANKENMLKDMANSVSFANPCIVFCPLAVEVALTEHVGDDYYSGLDATTFDETVAPPIYGNYVEKTYWGDDGQQHTGRKIVFQRPSASK